MAIEFVEGLERMIYALSKRIECLERVVYNREMDPKPRLREDDREALPY